MSPFDRRTPITDRPLIEKPLPRFTGRVLLVDDNQVNLLIAQEMLGALGISVCTEINGADALARLQLERFDLVILDLHMPVMDGLEVARALRERERRDGIRTTPLAALTADSTADDRARCLAAGMDGFLTKPVTLDQLTALAAGHLQSAAD